jgi:hypothetical protein
VRFFLLNSRAGMAAFASLLSVGVIAVAVSGVASGRTASPSKIVIHQHGTNIQNSPAGSATRGVFTIDLKGLPFGPGGKTTVYPIPSNTKYVNGQAQIPFSGTNHLTSTKGNIDLRFTGIHLDVNQKATPSGDVVGSAAEYGTWKITAAAGIYQGWKGRGNFAAVLYGYQNAQPYSVEWDGYITTP